MKDGLIYSIAKYIVDGLNQFNLVELFKWIGSAEAEAKMEMELGSLHDT